MLKNRKMAENVLTSNKVKKSRNDMIRSTLGVYLKNRNYTSADKFKRSDLFLTQTPEQFILNKMIEEDVSRVNSFLYSNVLCLTNHYNAVEQHFGRFVQFVQSQPQDIKDELSVLFGPLICHLYIELLKGREWKPACDFLNKHAHLVAPIDNLNAPLPNKINGCSVAAASSNNANDDAAATETTPTTNTTNSSSSASASYPTATTQILFANESTGNSIRDYFKEIIRILSTCLRIDVLDNYDELVLFRSSKYEIKTSLKSINVLKRYLAKQGHIIILNIFHTWIHLKIKDFIKRNADDDDNDDDDIDMGDDIDDFSMLKEDAEISSSNVETKSKINYCSEEIKIDDTIDNRNSIENVVTVQGTKTPPLSQPTVTTARETTNVYLKRLTSVMTRFESIDAPSRTIKIIDTEKSLTNVCIDSEECHMVAAYKNSTVKLWQLNRNICLGRNLYGKVPNRICEWSIEKYDETDDDKKTQKSLSPHLQKENEIFYSKKYEENSFDDSGGIILRGHTRGVTDCTFSKHFPLLFTTSKDCTIRAWKSKDYSCGAIYRGHNYPVWCLSESPIGTYLATGSRDYSARLWTIDREFPLITYVGHTQDVDCIAFHPNGNYLATGSCDLSVRLWSVTNGKLFRVFTECRFPITCISFSPDGKYLAAGGEETKVRIFDLAAGSQINELKDHTSPVTHIVWNSNGNKLASCCLDGSVRVWNTTKCIDNNNKDQQQSSNSITSFTTNQILHLNSNCNRGIKVSFNSNDIVTLIGSGENVATTTTATTKN